MLYVLDKNAHIKLEKILTKGILDQSEVSQIAYFINRNVYNKTSRRIYYELAGSDYALYTAIGSQVETVAYPDLLKIESTPSGKLYPSFSYVTEELFECKEITIQSIGKVESNDVSLIVKCIKDGGKFIIVTDDRPMAVLCESLGIKSINFEKFGESSGIKNILILKLINLIKKL